MSRSVDGGRTFETVYEAVHATNPPVLETDRDGNIYLVRPDFKDGNAYLYRFLVSNGFRDPAITTVPKGAAGKYAMYLDSSRKLLYYVAHNNTFSVIGLDGTVRVSRQLLRHGSDAALQYPLLSMSRGAVLHLAWTSQKHGKYLYWDIHHMMSLDAGTAWRNLGGREIDIPVAADQTGQALTITLDDESDSHTWLSSFIVIGGKVHFLYRAQLEPPRQHYVRYDISTARREIDRQPEFKGNQIRIAGLDGFFAANRQAESSSLYCLGHDDGRVACLVSHDNGETWEDHARSAERFHLYSLGGCRDVTDDGYLIGSFTDQCDSNMTVDRESKVYFLRIKVN